MVSHFMIERVSAGAVPLGFEVCAVPVFCRIEDVRVPARQGAVAPVVWLEVSPFAGRAVLAPATGRGLPICFLSLMLSSRSLQSVFARIGFCQGNQIVDLAIVGPPRS